MAGIAVTGAWSVRRTIVDIWQKWRLADQPLTVSIADAVRTDAVARLAPVPDGDRLVSALAALAQGDPDRATRLLAKAPDTAHVVTARGDVLAAQGNPAAAAELYRWAAEIDGSDPIAVLGRATAAIAAGDPDRALADIRTLPGAGPVVAHYLASALLCRANQVCAVSRDGHRVIATEAQLAECERICRELAAHPVDDPELAAAVADLTGQVAGSRAWTWRRIGGNGGILALVLAVSLAGVLLGGAVDNVWLVVGAALVGAGAVFLYVVTNRRPVWELRAQHMAHTITIPGR